MPNVPSEYNSLIALVEAELAKASKQMPPSAVLKQIYKELVREFLNAGGTAETFNAHLALYTAFNLTKVIGRAQGLAKQYPPTHRKGKGTDGGIVRVQQEPWTFYFDGTQGGSVGSGGDEGEPPDFGPTDGFDWAPDAEVARARGMLYAVASEMDFGYGDDPLELVRTVARRLGGRWGLNGKRGNANDVSKDILAWDIPGYLPQLFDVINDAGRRNGLQWFQRPYGEKSVWISP